jgi:hypothetical protein
MTIYTPSTSPIPFPSEIPFFTSDICEIKTEKDKRSSKFLKEIPFEALVFAVAALAAKIFIPFLTYPLMAISSSMFITALVFKISQAYNVKVIYKLTDELYKYNKLYPKLQPIGFVFAMAISYLYVPMGVIYSSLFGVYSEFILQVEFHQMLIAKSIVKD